MRVASTATPQHGIVGTRLATGSIAAVPGGGRPVGPVVISAGAVLERGITDPARAGAALVARTWRDRTMPRGLVAFVRRGDAWDAVTMVATDRSGRAAALWSPFELDRFQLDASAGVDAIWQVSPYGFDARLGASDSMLPGS